MALTQARSRKAEAARAGEDALVGTVTAIFDVVRFSHLG